MKKIFKIAIVGSIFFACLFWFLKKFKLQDFFYVLENLDMKLIGGAVLIFIAINIIRAYRFVLYLGFSIKKFHWMLYFYFAGTALNLCLARSGDIFRTLLIFDKLKINLVKSFVYLGIERIFDLLVVINLLCLGNIFVLTKTTNNKLYYLIGAITILAVSVLLAIYKGGFLYKIIPFHLIPFSKKIKRNLKKQILRVLSGFKTIKSPRLLIASLLLSVIIWLGEMLIYTIILKATGIEIKFWESIVVISATIFSYLVPTIPGALAVYEASVIGSLELLDKSGQLAAAAFILHSFYIIVALTIGIPCLFLSRPNFKQFYQRIRNNLK